MREGWEEYRWRSRLPQHWIDGKPIAEWDGAPMPGKTLFVRPEQGLGDTIQFCRYVPLIAPRARVIFGVPRPLHRLLRQLAGIDAVITEGDPTPVYDAECVMMSLPRLLARYEPADSGPVPYLRADPASVAALALPPRSVARPENRPRLGWQSGVRRRHSRRSMALFAAGLVRPLARRHIHFASERSAAVAGEAAARRHGADRLDRGTAAISPTPPR